mmetsp:Transcript_35751/g.33890  ORF Transcript_35751/g.33890 Transcript_35751/m.33890 type:complete len:242 (-) Transcript_35751:48-773(-)
MNTSKLLLLIVSTLYGALSMSLSKYSIKQSINIPGLKKAFQTIFKPSLFIPQINVRSINDINFIDMKSNGINCIIFDKDNTLSYTYIDELHPSFIDKMIEVKKIFPEAVAILSNSVGSCDDYLFKSAIQTEKKMNLPVIRHQIKKPSCLKEVLDHFESVLKRKVSPQETCMIGDRVLTDVVFANQNGMLSVLVAPLSISKDHPIAVLIRWLETLLLLPLLKLIGVKKRPIIKTQNLNFKKE